MHIRKFINESPDSSGTTSKNTSKSTDTYNRTNKTVKPANNKSNAAVVVPQYKVRTSGSHYYTSVHGYDDHNCLFTVVIVIAVIYDSLASCFHTDGKCTTINI